MSVQPWASVGLGDAPRVCPREPLPSCWRARVSFLPHPGGGGSVTGRLAGGQGKKICSKFPRSE